MHFLTNILGKTLWEVLKGLFLQIAWNVIAERFITRLVIWGLEKMKNMSTNAVTQDTVNDIILSLKGKNLSEVELWEST